MEQFAIAAKKRKIVKSGRLAVWIEGDEIFIRETCSKNDIQTVCVSKDELQQALLLVLESKPPVVKRSANDKAAIDLGKALRDVEVSK